MGVVGFIIAYLFLQFDCTLLKKRALPIFMEVFRFSFWQLLVCGLFLVAAVLKTGEQGFDILRVYFIVLFLVYLLRRSQFWAMVKVSPEFSLVQNDALELALETFSIIALWALGMVVVSGFGEIVAAVLHYEIDQLIRLLLLSEISSLLLVILVYRAVRARKDLKLFQVLGLETKSLGVIKIWIIPAVFALVYAIVTSLILDARPIQPITPLQDLLSSTTSLGVLLFFVGTAVLTAPFFEEIIFRGFFFYVFAQFKGVVFAVIFIALTFGFLHVEQYWGDWSAIAVVGFFGLSLTVLRAWTGSSVPGMIAHYVYNTSLVILPVIMIVFSNPLYLDYQINYYRLTAEQKEERLLKSIAQYPQFSDSYNDLAWLYSEEGVKLERALELIDKALALEPENYAFLDTKAEVLFKMRRVAEAIAIEENLIKRYPKDPYLREQLKKFHSLSLKENEDKHEVGL